MRISIIFRIICKSGETAQRRKALQRCAQRGAERSAFWRARLCFGVSLWVTGLLVDCKVYFVCLLRFFCCLLCGSIRFYAVHRLFCGLEAHFVIVFPAAVSCVFVVSRLFSRLWQVQPHLWQNIDVSSPFFSFSDWLTCVIKGHMRASRVCARICPDR